MSVGTLFLDVEVYSRRPDYSDAVLVAVGVEGSASQVFRSFDLSGRRPLKLVLSREKDVVQGFVQFLEDQRDSYDVLFLVGWNIINFDLPLIYHKAVKYGYDVHRAWHLLFHGPNIIDLRQVYICMNRFRLKGTLNDAVRSILGVDRTDSGSDVSSWLESGNYSAVYYHLLDDLKYVKRLYWYYRRYGCGSPEKFPASAQA